MSLTHVSSRCCQIQATGKPSVLMIMKAFSGSPPLTNPQILRNCFKAFTTFLFANSLVDIIQYGFCDGQCLLDLTAILRDVGILQDLRSSSVVSFCHTIRQTCRIRRGYFVIRCTLMMAKISIEGESEGLGTY